MNNYFLSGDVMNFHIEYEQEIDGRWLAEVPEIPGVLTYGVTANEAMAKAEILALRALAERIETGEINPMSINIELVVV
jgi:predicted RNase H-like HicB family nuclease